MADKLELTVQINADTGQLEVVGQKIEGLGQKTKGLASEATNLAKSFLPFATAGGITAFFVSAVRGAEEQNESFRRLQATLEMNGQSWEKNRLQIELWTNAVANSTRFSDGEAVAALDKFTRITGSLAQAQSASILAMNLSVSSGKTLAETISLVTDLLNGNERSLIQVKKEFANVAGGAKTTQEAIDLLSAAYENSAVNSKGFTDSNARLKNSFSQLQDTVGNALIPTLTFLMDWTKKAIQGYQQLGIVLAGVGAIIVASFKNRSIDQIKAAFNGMIDEINAFELKAKSAVSTGEEERLAVTRAALAKKKAEEAAAAAEALQQKNEQAAKVQAIEAQISQNLAALSDNEFQRKNQILNAEVNARRQKIMREINDERQKAMLLAKLDQEHLARQQFIAKAEVQIKQAVALQTAETSLQALALVNDMSKKDTEGQVVRAKAILALEKSIAIARILSSPQAVLNPGLAAAQIALTVAQFAQQFQAIDSAKNAFQQSSNQIASQSVPLPGGGSLTTIGGGGGGFNFGGGGGGGGGGPSGPSSSGAGFVINIAAGAIVVNGSVGVDDIASRIGEKIIEQIKGQGQLSMTREG